MPSLVMGVVLTVTPPARMFPEQCPSSAQAFHAHCRLRSSCAEQQVDFQLDL